MLPERVGVPAQGALRAVLHHLKEEVLRQTLLLLGNFLASLQLFHDRAAPLLLQPPLIMIEQEQVLIGDLVLPGPFAHSDGLRLIDQSVHAVRRQGRIAAGIGDGLIDDQLGQCSLHRDAPLVQVAAQVQLHAVRPKQLNRLLLAGKRGAVRRAQRIVARRNHLPAHFPGFFKLLLHPQERFILQKGIAHQLGIAVCIQQQEHLIAQHHAVAQRRGIPAVRLSIAKVRIELGKLVGADLPDVVIAGQHDDRHALLLRCAQLFDQRLVLRQPSLIGDVPQQQHDVGAAIHRVPQECVDDLQVIGLQRIDDVGIPERRVDMEVGRGGNFQSRPVFLRSHVLLGRRLRAQDGQRKAQQPCSNPFHLRTPFQKIWSSVSRQAPAAWAQAF